MKKDHSILNFGRHKGSHISEVPADYLEWLIRARREEADFYEDELRRRDDPEDDSKGANAPTIHSPRRSPPRGWR